MRRRFFHRQLPARTPRAINPRTAELGSGTEEIAPNRPFVLLSSPAVKKSVSVEPARHRYRSSGPKVRFRKKADPC